MDAQGLLDLEYQQPRWNHSGSTGLFLFYVLINSRKCKSNLHWKLVQNTTTDPKSGLEVSYMEPYIHICSIRILDQRMEMEGVWP